MSRRDSILIGLFLVAVIAIGSYAVWQRSPLHSKAVRAEEKAIADSRRPLAGKVELKDGSFNPLPPVKAKPSDSPADTIAANHWRDVYEPLLKQAGPADGQPGFYVYTFLDRTKDGVGIQFTYGWQPLGTAALAALTRARLTQTAPPDRYGLPIIDEQSTAPLAEASPQRFAPPTLEEAKRRALADSATSAARYIVLGCYEDEPGSAQCKLTVYLIDRQNPDAGNEIPLYQSNPIDCGDLNALSADQREAVRKMTDKLIGMDLAPKRRAPKATRPDLDAELGKVANMLDTEDAWAIMDGIDQALALQQLYPDETMPIQAAAYGLQQLTWSYFQYRWTTIYKIDYVMRAYGLAQLALAMNPKPAMSQLNLIAANKCLGVVGSQLLAINTADDSTRSNPELLSYRKFVLDDIHGDIRGDLLAAAPDWLALWQDQQQSGFDGRPHQARQRFDECFEQWRQRDAYVVAFAQNLLGYGYPGLEKVGFYRYIAASAPFTQATIAAELATILMLEPDAARDQACSEAAGLTGANDADLKLAAANHDYYKLRASILQGIAQWDAPRDAGHPAYETLKWMNTQAAAILADPRWSASGTGYAGLDFTRAEMLRFFQRRDHIGPMLVANHEEKVFGSVNGSGEICEWYLKARPGNAGALHEYALYLTNNMEDDDLVAIQRRGLFLNTIQAFPVNYDNYYNIGRADYYLDSRRRGLNYIYEYMRLARFSSDRATKMAEFASRYGFNAEAVKFYDEALKLMPKRYDLADDRADLLCQMGKYMDPEIRKTFATPVQALVGNSTFHERNLEYLYHWVGETTSTREAAAFFRQTHPDSQSALLWQFNVERFDGNTTKALDILNGALEPPASARDPLSIASHYASVAQRFMDLGMLDKARPYIEKSEQFGPGMGNVIRVVGRYYYLSGNYDKAIAQYEAELERYGQNTDLIEAIAQSYDKMGQLDRAIGMIETRMLASRANSTAIYLAPRLLEFYEKKGEKEKSRKVMTMVIESPRRTRAMIFRSLKIYEKLYPKEAAEIRKNIDQIMAGPKLFE